MKTVSIFLASSEELREERLLLGDFVNGLRRTFKRQGIDLELVKWEDLDSAFNGRSKEGEYLDEVRRCQIFVALFHTVAGKYTRQELDVARKSLAENNLPAIFIFMKDLAEGENVTQELEELKEKILHEWEHFKDNYGHPDTLKLRFLQQLILKLNDPALKLEVENSVVRLDDAQVASLDNVPFAANNEQYKKLKQEISEVNKRIGAYEQVLAAGENPVIAQMMAEEKRKRADLNEELAQYEKDLFATAQRLAAIKSKAMDERMRKASELFENGDNKGADALLDMQAIDRDIAWIMDDVQKARANATSIISQLTFKAKNLITIYDNPARLDQADEAYAKALDVAKKARVEGGEMVDLLEEYQTFLANNARYGKALEIGEEWLKTSHFVFGEDHINTATAYNNIGFVYSILGEYNIALAHYFMTLQIYEKIFEKDETHFATAYNNVGSVCSCEGDYDRAFGFHSKALYLREKLLGTEHSDTASSYNNIGNVYFHLGDYDKALEYHDKALEIRKKVFGEEHPDTASSYNNIGNTYFHLGDYDKALENIRKSLRIFEEILGKEHPETANAYDSIAAVYDHLGDSGKALEYYGTAIEILEKVLGKENPTTAISYNNIGCVYSNLGDNEKALEYYKLALKTFTKALGEKHPYTLSSLESIACKYLKLGNEKEGLKYMKRAAELGDEQAQRWIKEIMGNHNRQGRSERNDA